VPTIRHSARNGGLRNWNPFDFQNVVRSYTGPRKKGRTIAVAKANLSDLYRNYIACLNKQDWPKLGQFVHRDVIHNGRRIGLSGYLEMLERDFDEIPDLHFKIQMLIADPPRIASRLSFDCTPKGTFLGLHVGGKRVSFTENVFYEFRTDKIREVWSVIDKAAIEAQL
jgi:predicted ester cyclase